MLFIGPNNCRDIGRSGSRSDGGGAGEQFCIQAGVRGPSLPEGQVPLWTKDPIRSRASTFAEVEDWDSGQVQTRSSDPKRKLLWSQTKQRVKFTQQRHLH